MRCSCCDRRLSNQESVLKHEITGEYLDTCMKCLDGLGIPITEPLDLPEDDDFDELFPDSVMDGDL